MCSSKGPLHATNCTMEPYATGKTVVVQENSIHGGPEYPSQLRLMRLPPYLVADKTRKMNVPAVGENLEYK